MDIEGCTSAYDCTIIYNCFLVCPGCFETDTWVQDPLISWTLYVALAHHHALETAEREMESTINTIFNMLCKLKMLPR